MELLESIIGFTKCSGISMGHGKIFQALIITENMHFITTKCIVTLKIIRRRIYFGIYLDNTDLC